MQKWNIHLNSSKLVRVTGKKLLEVTIEQQGKQFSSGDFCRAKNFQGNYYFSKNSILQIVHLLFYLNKYFFKF